MLYEETAQMKGPEIIVKTGIESLCFGGCFLKTLAFSYNIKKQCLLLQGSLIDTKDLQKCQNIGCCQQAPKQEGSLDNRDSAVTRGMISGWPLGPNLSYLHGTVESANRALTTDVFILFIYPPLLPGANIVHQFLDGHGMRTWNMHRVPVKGRREGE